jgi:hypothetical protein
MFKVKETGNHLYNAARQNQNRAPASNTNWNPIVSRKPVTCFSWDLHLSFLSPYYPLSSWFLILDHFCCCPYLSIVLSYRYSGSFELYALAGQQLNIKAEEFVPNNSIEKDDNVTDVDNEVSLGNKPISDPRTDDSEKECNLPSLSIVNCPRLIENIALPSSTNGCPSAPANVQDFFNCGCLSLGICLKAFVEITVLAAPVSAVNIILEDDALLGLDILMKGPGGPADIKLTKGEILLNGTTITCIRIGQSEIVRKVRSADDFYIHDQKGSLVSPDW